MDGLVRIGDFSRMGGVSVKTLRFYAEKGLLAPAQIDPATGYRYYRIEQIDMLALIVNLRAAGFTLAEISQAQEAKLNPDRLKLLIEAKRIALAAEQNAVAERIAVASALSQCLEANPPELLGRLRLTRIPAQLAHTRRLCDADKDATITTLFERAEAAVAQHERRADVAPFLILREPPQTEVCIPITAKMPGLTTKLIPGHDLACSLVYEGDYSQTSAAVTDIEQWVDAAGFRPAGPMREIYHRFGADQEGYSLPGKMLAERTHQYVTEVSLPIVAMNT